MIRKKTIFDSAAGRLIREARDVLFLGPPGTGKSHLAQAIGHTVIKAGRTVLLSCCRSQILGQESTTATDGDRSSKTIQLIHGHCRPFLARIELHARVPHPIPGAGDG